MQSSRSRVSSTRECRRQRRVPAQTAELAPGRAPVVAKDRDLAWARVSVAARGGGAYRPGNGVLSPQLIREVKPNYTVEAMRAKVQGVVLLECVVQTDGSVGEIKILKSLDKAFGLDEEAIKAARQWRFVPGRLLGDAVPVYVTLELALTLR